MIIHPCGEDDVVDAGDEHYEHPVVEAHAAVGGHGPVQQREGGEHDRLDDPRYEVSHRGYDVLLLPPPRVEGGLVCRVGRHSFQLKDFTIYEYL